MPIFFVGIASCEPQAEEIKRHNALREIYPADFSKLSSSSRQHAVDYIAGWMKVFGILGTSGIRMGDNLEKAHQEILPRIQPLAEGTQLDREAFKAGLKIYEALDYLATRLRDNKPFDNKDMNALLRYAPGDEANPAKMSDGVGNLFFDYVQMVDEINFRRTAAEAKKRGLSFQP